MKDATINRRWRVTGFFLALAGLGWALAAASADPPQKPKGKPPKDFPLPSGEGQGVRGAAKPRPIRVAVFDVDVLQGVDAGHQRLALPFLGGDLGAQVALHLRLLVDDHQTPVADEGAQDTQEGEAHHQEEGDSERPGRLRPPPPLRGRVRGVRPEGDAHRGPRWKPVGRVNKDTTAW